MSDKALDGQQDVNSAATPSSAATSDVNQSSQAPSQQASPDVNKQSDTSTDTGVKTDGSKSLKDLITDGLSKMAGEDPAKAAPTEGKDPAKQDAKDGKVDGADDDKKSEEEKNAPTEINNHPAFKKVVSERTEARKQVKELQAQLEPLKADATRYQTLQTFLKTNNVDQKDAAEALKITALATTDPQAFYNKLVELTKQWGEHLGHTLPADLQSEVDQGIISPERAAELAKMRGQVTVATQQVERVQQVSQEQQQRQEMEYRVKLYENWAAQVGQTDPDLKAKVPMIRDRMHYLLQTEGDPGSPEAAWNRLNRVYQEVNDSLRSFAPPKQPTAPSPRSTGTPVGATSAPSNYEEAMQVALQNISRKTV